MTRTNKQRAIVPCTRKRMAAKNHRGNSLSNSTSPPTPLPSPPTSPTPEEKGPVTRSRAKKNVQNSQTTHTQLTKQPLLKELKLELEDALTRSEKHALFFAPIPESEEEKLKCVTFSELSSVPKRFFSSFVPINNFLGPFNSTSALFNCLGDGSTLNIAKCTHPLCKLDFEPRDFACSSVTNRIYKCIVPPGNTGVINCCATNVIYLLTCDKCRLQYVGETVLSVKGRFHVHKQGFDNPEKYGCCKYLTEHFTSGHCKDSTYKVQILEKLDGNGRTEVNGRLIPDKSVTYLRKKKETQWMLKLRTVYPYGLNDRVGDDWATQRNKKLVGKQFTKLSRTFPRRSKGNGKNSPKLEPGTFLNIIDHLLQTSLPDVMNYIRITVASLKKTILKKITGLIKDTVFGNKNQEFVQWYMAIIDAIESKLLIPTVEQTKKRPDSVLNVKFHNKAVELINVPNILHSPLLSSSFPNELVNNEYVVPTVVYNLEDSIHSKVFNYNKFVSKLDLNEFLRDETILPCNCANSPFIDNHHGHIITGDLKIVTDSKLRNLLSKGPNHREPVTLNFDKAKEEILSGVNLLTFKWADKYKVHNNTFDAWKLQIDELITKRITDLKRTHIPRKVIPTLELSSPKQCLDNLKRQYVITPIDKATGNIAFMCKRFYANILVNELGLSRNGNLGEDGTYVSAQDSKENVLNRHKAELKSKFGIDIDDDNLSLPNMYWIPKKHKTPSKARFIVGASHCSVKPLAKALTSVFKLFYRQIEKYNKIDHFFTGVKTFWVIQDKKPVVNTIRNLNKRKNAKSIMTYDFSTLYTKIPHDKLKEVLHELTDFCFKGCTRNKILVNEYGATWLNTKTSESKNGLKFTIANVKEAITYLLDNCYFNVGDQIFKQRIGIPMGSDPAPFFANLFLYYYESRFIKELKKTDLPRARRFGNMSRFIDDLSAINDNGEFDRCHAEIYPPELELKKENDGSKNASFLDLDITIKNDKTFSLKLYDKRDTFPFDIVRLPHISNNMPSRIFYATLGGELLRTARCTSDCENFINSSQSLIKRMRKQGAKVPQIKRTINRTFLNHPADFEPLCSVFDFKKALGDTLS